MDSLFTITENKLSVYLVQLSGLSPRKVGVIENIIFLRILCIPWCITDVITFFKKLPPNSYMNLVLVNFLVFSTLHVR